MERRRDRWKMLVNNADSTVDFQSIYPYQLDISWNPVKINKHGTLEYRGMSMNYLSIVFGVSILLNFCLQKIQREFIEIVPDDDISKAFSLENGILRIPAHTHVRNVFQKDAAYEGLKNEELFEYVSAFYKFAKSVTPKEYYPLLQRVEEMINNRKTVSDEIFDYAKKNKLIKESAGTWKLSTENAEKIALHLADKFEKDMAKTQKTLIKIAEEVSD